MHRATIIFSAGVLSVAFSAGTAWASGAVYAMTNALANNQVLVYTRASNGTLSSTRVGLTTVGLMLRGFTKPAVPGLGIAVSSKKRDGCPVAGTCLMRCPNELDRRQMSKISVWYNGTSIAPGPMKSAAA